ncbi:hypothetical protein AUK11_02405 [bacterium CG2_30_37_16]|nr:MAG: hypothetical protein AUK11_02405 [bacterium CG2_30_37_16]PIP30261.1 MAG: hypothetical protein COX25_05555 [bacterium (Candidatus Howlettbacteria) CG23_combo_of_CG06-09_8_20_14_all_37_9]PIY00093.1 MAG: hypothetical protein COZ22_01105 [bacterium (Candidatus Howlettbacteria) CG_4_10_14_3_um_filter_37_10]PJB06555.1 MAG: hypothetical protein CO123_01910 [bacterium (Candidatus Howlettbacteria) CG_4_9_14_3_um_filter_37_10]
MSKTIYLARHGETEYNRLQKITGQLDIPLNDVGLEQAMMLSLSLKDIYFDVIYSSSLKRCRQTVTEVKKFHKGVPIVFDSRLKECNAGVMEGEPCSVMADYTEKFTPRGGESFYHLKSRVRDFLADQIYAKDFENILVVSHGGPIKVIRSFFENTDTLSEKEMSIKNANYWIIKTNLKELTIHTR